jgi:nucleoside-diphosphate-sugar epimerase
MSSILLTGASGFIGTRLKFHLRDAGMHVISVGRGAQAQAERGVDHRQVPELTVEAIRTALGNARIDAIAHLAAAGVRPGERDPALLIRVNAVLPGDMAMLADELGARALIVTGSNSEYARHDENAITEGCALETEKLYGATKAAGGLLAVANGIARGVTTANLRLFNVFGPGEAPHRLLPSLVTALAGGDDVRLSEGLQVRDFVHVDDACRAIVAATLGGMDGTLPSGHYNVCTGEGHTVRQFAKAVAAHVGVDPSRLRFGALPLRPDDLPHVVGDPRRLMNHVAWRPTKSFDAWIAHTIAELSESIHSHE